MKVGLSLRVFLMAGITALTACAASLVDSDQSVIERLGNGGLSAPQLEAGSSAPVNFVNSDGQPHQIYSNDCPELSTTVLAPGNEYRTRVGEGPKTCHFEDLLAPASPTYSGTVKVKEPPPSDTWFSTAP
jgi:hypothetical protein